MQRANYIALVTFPFIAGIVASVLDFYALATILGIIGAIFLIFYTKRLTTGYNSFLTLLVIFFFAYTFSVPLSILLGFEYVFFDIKEFYMQEFLLQSYFCYLGLAIGIFSYSRPLSLPKLGDNKINVNPERLLRIAVMLGALSSIMEIINVYRIGGVSSLYAGKAAFQESLGDVQFTLPSRFLCDLAAAALGMSIAIKKKFAIKYFIVFLIAVGPLLAVTLIAGQRGPILGWVCIVFVGSTYFTNLKKLKFKAISGVLSIYIVMSLIFNYRSSISYYFSTGDASIYNTYSDKDRIQKNLNPANNEFGAAFGNFNVFVAATKNRPEDPYYGLTYLKGFLIIIPGVIYPGEKPKQISYEFRDKYFSTLASRSRIAGTGFSSVLEAYMNFGYLGSFLFFILLGRVFIFLESKRTQKTFSLFSVMMYLTLLPIAQSFHRAAFGGAISEFLYKILFFTVILLIIGKLQFFLAKRSLSTMHEIKI